MGKPEAEQKWARSKTSAYLIALCIVILDIIALVAGTFFTKIPVALSVGCVGIITFIGTLTLTNSLSRDPALNKHEMRKSIAASFSLVYLALLALVTFGQASSADTELAKTVVGHFTWVVGIIIVFYFGSRSVEGYLKKRGQSEDDSED